MARDELEVFFRVTFGRNAGFICIGLIPQDMKGLTERFFHWPTDEAKMIEYIRTNKGNSNVYFCPQLLQGPRRKKDRVETAPNIWADLDTCGPDKLLVDPTILIESSPNRYQAIWALEHPLPPAEAEDLARRIAYFHAPHGADRSGWDLTQLLRVPNTTNYKYDETPTVVVVSSGTARYRPSDFTDYPEVKNSSLLTLPLPTAGDMPTMDANDLLQSYRRSINPNTFFIWSTAPSPNADWSTELWKLMMFLFEAGMTREEVFVVTKEAACNKYVRDGKPDEYLWRDVCRAYLRHEENVNVIVTPSEQEDLLSPEEVAWAEAQETFVERYTKWASGLGDAATQYHPAAAFTILSALLGGRVKLPTSFGVLVLNLWFMILADTTLTRKSTAMDIGIDLLALVDDDAILATDGSVEGLMTGLQGRPNRPSVFLRDEFSGLIEQMTKKDYYAGMMETLTKMYDGKMQKRILRKETITILNPVLIILAGGIKAKVQQLLSFEHISSGFVPRFVFITAESNTSRMQPLGPPTERDYSGRDALIAEMQDIYSHYVVPIQEQGPGFTLNKFKEWEAELTPEAWARYNKLEAMMMQAGLDSGKGDLMTPLYDRLSKSILKAAVLLAASEQRTDTVVVDENHLIIAINYGRGWRNYANEVVNGVGMNAFERELEKILRAIINNPGINRSRLMQNYHLTARTADAVFSTLEQRGQITASRQGRGWVFYAQVTG
jgi:hypothetical protein